MATRKSKRRTPKDPREMAPEEFDALVRESERKIALMARFGESEEWRLIAEVLDVRIRRMENEGKGFRRRLMRPVAGQPPVTLEQIASHEARLDETVALRRLPKFLLGFWGDQMAQLQAIRDEAPR